MNKKFKIDFFEFAFLVEACIPPMPIARSIFFNDVSLHYYYQMNENERSRLYAWILRTPRFEQSIKEKNESCIHFKARFNPKNQYKVTTNYKGKIKTENVYKYLGAYHLTKEKSIINEYITNVEQILIKTDGK